MKRLVMMITIGIALSACQSDADMLAFPEVGTVFMQGDSVCFGNSGKSDVLSYYYLEDVNNGKNVPLIYSGDKPLHLTYPDNCLKIKLEPEKRYGALYIMNNAKYHYDFITNDNGIILKM